MTKKEISNDTIPVYGGVDVGSLTAKSVILSDKGVIGRGIIPTGINAVENGEKALGEALKDANLKREDLDFVVATGYGRISAPYADKTVTEITCHAQGAHYLHPEVRTIVDMGGQDCKAIRLDENGLVIDFAMNDKCAAGTGRFFEVMSRVFNTPLQELGPLSLTVDEILPMSSTCTVFVESETVSLLARGESPAKIIRGIHYAIANRISGMFSRVGVENDVLFTGGVAKNPGMKKALEDVLKSKIIVTEFDPQLNGALGAAVIAKSNGSRKKGE